MNERINIMGSNIELGYTEDYVKFGDVSRNLLGQQCQYGSRYVTGLLPEEYPNLGYGLRFKNHKSSCYHSIEVHKEDVPELVRRVSEYKENEFKGLNRIPDFTYREASAEEMTIWSKELMELQEAKNDGMGVSCIRTVANCLKRHDMKSALAACNIDNDKIRNYPDIVDYMRARFYQGDRFI